MIDVILITDDGKPIKHGDSFYWVDNHTLEINGPVKANKNKSPNPNNAKFISLTNAINYVRKISDKKFN